MSASDAESSLTKGAEVTDANVTVVDYEPRFRSAFRTLNEAWIQQYFRIEPADVKVLEAPDEYILAPGGHILVALHGAEPVGVCALIRHSAAVYELAKMAVAPAQQGRGVGRTLGEAAIRRARECGAERLFLESNRKLLPALALYRRLGFVEVKGGPPSPYQRSDIRMELALGGQPGAASRG